MFLKLFRSFLRKKLFKILFPLISPQFSSVAQSCPTLCHPMNRSMLGLPVHHQLPEFTQTHVLQVSDAIQPSHPVVPFSSCPQSLPASGSFSISIKFHEILVSQIYCLLIYIVYVYMDFIYQKCNIILYSRINSYLLGSPSAH